MNSIFSGIDFGAPSVAVAQQLIGATILLDGVGGRIVETEAYDMTEPASHSFCGPTLRNASLFGPPGHVYVYLSHGIHWCLNFVCRENGHGAGVLIRAIEPLSGLALMQQRRRTADARLLCSGPGRLGQALALSRAHDGLSLGDAPFQLSGPGAPQELVAGPRIGISKAMEVPWRFGLAGSPFLSRPFR